jgi:hypothetical protein
MLPIEFKSDAGVTGTLFRTVLTHALSAPHDSNRPVWDVGRRAEVRALLAKFDNRSDA